MLSVQKRSPGKETIGEATIIEHFGKRYGFYRSDGIATYMKTVLDHLMVWRLHATRDSHGGNYHLDVNGFLDYYVYLQTLKETSDVPVKE